VMIKVFINNLALIFFINDENYFIVIITFKLPFHSVLARFVAFVSLSGFFLFLPHDAMLQCANSADAR